MSRVEFLAWLEDAERWVIAQASAEGWRLDSRSSSRRTGSVYLRLVHVSGVGVCVRLADHGLGRHVGERLFSVRWPRRRRLRDLVRFLRRVLEGRPDPWRP